MPRKHRQTADLAAEQRQTTRRKLRRKVLLVLIGVVALTTIAGTTTWFEPDTLVKETVVIGDVTYVCRITNVRGELLAEWSRRTMLWRTGKTETAHLGFVNAVGTANPKIALDSTTSRILFEVGGVKSIVRPGL